MILIRIGELNEGKIKSLEKYYKKCKIKEAKQRIAIEIAECWLERAGYKIAENLGKEGGKKHDSDRQELNEAHKSQGFKND